MSKLKIGSHVGFNKDTQLLGSVKEALSYNSTTFMFYTGAPQNTIRASINDLLTYEAMKLMKEHDIDIKDVIVHAPYIINLGNTKIKEKYRFSVDFLINECKRCEELGITKMVLHSGSHVGLGEKEAIFSISQGLSKILSCTNVTILLETMAGKGSEVGKTLDEIKEIIDSTKNNEKLGICLDTCHLWDSGYNIKDFDNFVLELKKRNLLEKVLCIHLNDSKNDISSHKDRHENIGYGFIGFNALLNICYKKEFENIPKILETPYIDNLPPYKFEIEMLKSKKFNETLKEDVINYYK